MSPSYASVNAGNLTFIWEDVTTSSPAWHPYRGPAAIYRCLSIVLPNAQFSVKEEQGNMQRKIKGNRHNTLSPASVDKSVDKVARPFKFH
jgi:hypothetical protein